jgi:peptide/nickel transport system substrate-binding protein
MPHRANRASRRTPSFAFSLLRYLITSLLLVACSGSAHKNRDTVTLLIESNPANLDPRFATDGQSQHLDGLLFNSLVERDDQMVLHGDLAASWETPDPLTYIFHLKTGVTFHDGRALTSADVKFTLDYIRDLANHSPKRGTYRLVTGIEAPDPATVIIHLSSPDASLLWNLCRPALGIVPQNAPANFAQHPIGTGPFRFVSQAQDDDVVLARNENYFAGAPPLENLHVRVVPDAIVRALELRKGSAEISSLSSDMIPVLAKQRDLAVTERPGTNVMYLGFNLNDPLLARREVRQAIAYATDRAALIRYLLHGEARIAEGLLPPDHWAYEGDVTHYALDPARATQLLDAAGFPAQAQKNGMRIHLVLKTSTEEPSRLMAAALQQQWRKVGIDLEIRPLEFATLLSDSIKGNFQINLLRWVGANNDPDIFGYVYSSARIPPDGANRSRYRNEQVDKLTAAIQVEMDQEKRKELCSQVQKIVAADLPVFPLWFVDVVSVHRRELGNLNISSAGDFDFLATLAPRGTSLGAQLPLGPQANQATRQANAAPLRGKPWQ